MKLIGIGGEPATGKTTLVRAIIGWLGPRRDFAYGTLRGLWFDDDRVIVLGIYDDKLFSGTDRLSMAVQPAAEMFLLTNSRSLKLQDYTIIFEGDRLFNAPTIRMAREVCPCLFGILDVPEEEKLKRHVARGDKQSATFQKSRRTKYERLVSTFPFIERWPNQTHDDAFRIMDRLRLFGLGVPEPKS